MKESSAILTLDRGNSSLKASVVIDGKVVETLTMPEVMIEPLLPLLERHAIEDAIYCSVGKHDVRFIESLRRLLYGGLMVLTHSTPVPLKISYSTPDTLGVDRVAAACGAMVVAHSEDAMLVVDAGTAITSDIVAEESFMGGNIAPGIGLRFDSLHNHTARLPIVSPEGELPEFGHDTATAIRCGVVGGVVAEVAALASMIKEKYGSCKVLLTGGDSQLIYRQLTKLNIAATLEPNLVALGLAAIYRFNEYE